MVAFLLLTGVLDLRCDGVDKHLVLFKKGSSRRIFAASLTRYDCMRTEVCVLRVCGPAISIEHRAPCSPLNLALDMAKF